MEGQRKSPLNKRLLTTQNVFIIVCREWLKHMKELKPSRTWDKLKFSLYNLDHSLTRRLAIAFHEIECDNNDQCNLLPDRYRQYWNSRKLDIHSKVFGEAEPVLFLLANYKFPVFSLKDSLPTFASAYSNVESVNTNFIQNLPSTSGANFNHNSNFNYLDDYELCLNTMIDYLKYGSFANTTNSVNRIALILSKSGFSSIDNVRNIQFDSLVKVYCNKLGKYESLWNSIENAINLKIKKNESTYESVPLMFNDHPSSQLIGEFDVSDENALIVSPLEEVCDVISLDENLVIQSQAQLSQFSFDENLLTQPQETSQANSIDEIPPTQSQVHHTLIKIGMISKFVCNYCFSYYFTYFI